MPATHVVLVVARAAAVNEAVLADGGEGIHGPFLALHAHHVGVAHDQDRPLRAVALDARHQVGAGRIQREQLRTGMPSCSSTASTSFATRVSLPGGLLVSIFSSVVKRSRISGSSLLPIHRIALLRADAAARHSKTAGRKFS